MSDDLRADVAELKRQMACVVKWAGDGPYTHCKDDGTHGLYRDLTTPPPPPRPVIEVVQCEYADWDVRCGQWYFAINDSGEGCWAKLDPAFSRVGTYQDKYVAMFVRNALTAAGNFPAEFQEKAR